MPRFQFTIRGLLWATFWVAASAAAWSASDRLRGPAEAAALMIGLYSPFCGLAAFLAEKRGFAILLVAIAMVLLVVLAMMIYVSEIQSANSTSLLPAVPAKMG